MRLSEFNRPWQSDGYPQMEYTFPSPDWVEPRPIDQHGLEYFDRIPGCIVSCFAPLYCDDDVFCHPAIFFYPRDMTVIQGAQQLTFRVLYNGAEYSNWDYSVRNKHGVLDVYPLKIHPPVASGEWAIWPDSPMDEVEVQMKDLGGNTCRTTLKVFCRDPDTCCDDEAYAFTFDDDSTADTIAPEGNITVYVTGGCPPFVFATSSTGYSFTAGTTNNRQDVLNCVAGDCGVEYDQYCSFTVTDACGTQVSGVILNTGGKWSETGNCGLSVDESSCALDCSSAGMAATDYSVDNTRWVITWSQSCWQSAATFTWSGCGGSPVAPGCGDPKQCSEYYGNAECTGSCPGCTDPIAPASGYTYYTWVCQ